MKFNELRDRVLNERSGKGIVFTFGRFNPPHSGHELLIKTVLKTAKKLGFEHGIYASTSHDNTRNPIPYKDKIKFLKSSFRGVNIVDNPKLKNPFFVAKQLSDDGYKNVTLVVGGDRVAELDREIRKYINHKDSKKAFYFDKFKVVSAGKRDPDSDDISGMSASKMRKLAAEGDYDTFKSGVPSKMSDRDSKKMYNSIRKSVEVKEEVYRFFDKLDLSKTSEEDFIKEIRSNLSEQALKYLGAEDDSNEDEDPIEDTPILVVLTKLEEDNKYSDTVERIEEASKKMGVSFYAVSVDDAFVVDEEVSDNELVIHNYDGDNNKITLKTDNTVCWPRGGVLSHLSGTGLFSTLQDAGVFCVNKLSHMELARNKFATAMLLEREKIPSPKTALVANEDAIDIVLKKTGNKFPVVLKTITGAEGIGVSIVDSYESLVSVLQSLWKFDAEIIMQEYIEIDYDIRSIVLDGKIIASMKRLKDSDDFRTNKALGNSTEPYDLSEEEKTLVKKAAKVTGCYLCGVDHLTINGEHKILEVNTSPGSGADKYTAYFNEDEKEISGQELIDYIVKYISDKDNWKFSAKEIGEIEQIDIDGVGILNAKSDTGNEGYNSLHAENIKVNDGNVSFTTEFGKEMSIPIVDTKRVNIGGGIVETRPVINLTFKMGNKTYKDEPFSLTDRDEMDYSVLLGKRFLKKANYSINVSKRYELSESERYALNIDFGLL